MHFITEKDLAQVHLAEGDPLRREAPRPKEKRPPGFEAAFDDRCIAYDIFEDVSGKSLILVGPPLLNLLPMLETSSFYITTDTGVAQDVTQSVCFVEKRKVGRLDIPISGLDGRATSLSIHQAERSFSDISINMSGRMIFEGRAVALTLFKYEPLSWLRAWAEFNVRYHKIDGLLIYENACPHASTQEIYEVLRTVEGLKALVVVAWPFKYGPQADGSGLWDSNFCQVGMLEHARERFLQSAKFILHGDIDELVVTEGHVPLTDLIKKTSNGILQPLAIAVSAPASDVPEHTLEDRHYCFYPYKGKTPLNAAVASKWAIDPAQTAGIDQWLVHRMRKMTACKTVSKRATLCHFININTGWKTDRLALMDMEPFPPLQEALKRVFGKDKPACARL